MKPIIKWAGGKEKELPIIKDNLPSSIKRYIEPFVGGGSVVLGLEQNNNCINDKSKELIDFYNCIKADDEVFFKEINKLYISFRKIDDLIDKNHSEIIDLFNDIISIDTFISNHTKELKLIGSIKCDIFHQELQKNLLSKIKRTKKIAKQKGQIDSKDIFENIEASIKSAYYMTIRYIYNTNNKTNKSKNSAYFYFIREYCYSSMFRYNKKGMFNVPYGGISYNRKNFKNKIEYINSFDLKKQLNKCEIYNLDFEEFFNKINPQKNDFIFLDPPYDTDFSTYSRNEFGQEEQIRLCNYLKETKANIMMIIKNTPFIYNLYKDDFNISSFDKTYLVSFKNRNDREVKHLIITNY